DPSAGPVEAVVDSVEGVGSLLVDDDDVLDAGPPLALDIDARLDGEGVARRQTFAVAGHDVRVLVLLQPDAVARAVHEVRPVPALGDDAAGDGVDVFARNARARGAHGLGLRMLQHGV